MQKVFKKCDRCGSEGFDNELELFEIGVTCRNKTTSSIVQAFPKQDWCRECVSYTALLGISEKEAEERRQKSLPQAQPATLDDIVREIAYEEAEAAISNRN